MLKILIAISCAGCSTFSFSLSLKEAVEHAVRYFPQIEASKAAMESSKASIRQEAAAFSPQVGIDIPFGYEYTREDTRVSSMTTTPLHAELHNFRSSPALTLRQLIYDGGYASARVLKASLSFQKSHEQYQSMFQEVALKTVSSYLNLLRLGKLKKIALENLEAHRNMLSKIKNLVEASDLTIADLFQVQARLEDAQLTLTNVENEIIKVRAEFKEYTGIDPVDLKDPMLQPFVSKLSQAVELVLRQNYTLNALKKDAEMVRANLKGVEAKFVPTVSAEVSGIRSQNGSASRGTRLQANALLVVRYNLFDGGSRAFERKGAIQNVAEADKKVSSLKLDLEKETQTTWSDIQTLARQEKIFEQATKYKKQVALSYVKQFDIGARSLLDILNAINDFFLTSALQVNASVNQKISSFKLMALGSCLLKEFGILSHRRE